MIEIKYYSKEFEAAQVVFAKRYWTKRRRFEPEYIYWKFRGVPDKILSSFILAFDGEKVVGQFGLIPCQVNIAGKIYDSQWACDLMVDENYRGKGVAEKLYEFAHKNKVVTLGSDPSPAAEKSMIKKGYLSLFGPRKFVFPFLVGEAFKLKGINNRFLNIIPNPFLLLFYLFKKSDYKVINTIEYARINDISSTNELYCVYDTSFYDWRFNEFKTYYQGIDCYKKNDFNFFSGYFVNKVYYLTDFKVTNVKDFLKMISFLYSKYKGLHIQRIKFVCMNPTINSLLPFLGFIRFSTTTKIILYTKVDGIKEFVKDKKFYYTLHDSDENI
ncbi:GNAT family N-acetyltransferase [Flavobacterium jejuense]|uniref:GNAT family N-acetyltransferase n=1 Tax=Flavobacterium jejuense TaxID=1544455 RepID=A0ABX0IQT9_9FLAO|nr:GNAT family N-acetyltransferase [Flavobacterium jejuense]NHN26177.1 GNAT family N-acetyltransferase [Flavobacterium jejuense]